jgi:hypothetical protein
MVNHPQWSSVVIVAAVAAATFGAVERLMTAPVAAFQEVENRPNPNDFGLFSVEPDDSVHVGIVNSSSIGDFTPGVCQVQISLYRADGFLVRQEWHNVAPGRGASSDIRGFEIDPSGPVQAWVHVAMAATRGADPSCAASLELVDRAGKRSLFYQPPFRLAAQPRLTAPSVSGR